MTSFAIAPRFQVPYPALLAALILVPGLALPTAAAPVTPPAPVQIAQASLLQRGDLGPAVRALQTALARNGLYEPSSIDGVYGQLTETAVRRYQANLGLPITGIADSALLQSLNVDIATAVLIHPTGGQLFQDRLTFGDQSQDVRALQQVLRQAYLNDIPLTGIYDSATRQAVRVFQRVNNLNVTGTADRDTLLAMGFSPTGVGGPADQLPYTAIIVAGSNQLSQAQTLFPNAYLLQTPEGEVISIGHYTDFDSAERQVAYARRRGFTAYVIDDNYIY